MNSTPDLIDEVGSLALEGAAVLPSSVTESVARVFTDRFVEDPGTVWWWTAPRLEVAVVRSAYGGDSIEPLRVRISEWGAALLLITDEKPTPCGCLLGSADGLIAALGSLRYFEFVVISPGFDRAIWDTHENVHLEWSIER